MILVRYNGKAKAEDLTIGQEYKVIAISLPSPKLPFFRIIDDSEEDYLYPWDYFDFVSGKDEFESFIEDDTPREEKIA